MPEPRAPLRAAVIGAGHFAYRVHMPVLASRPEVVLDSVCRLGADELALVRDEFGFSFATERWQEILERDVDIVVIASPHHLHYEQARAFLAKGSHVLIEKPMCLVPEEAWDLVELGIRTEREIVVAYGWHYKPGISRARELLERIGRIEHVLCHMASFTRNVFAGDATVARWRDVRIQPDAATWQDPANGGGFAWGQLSHALGLLYWLTDLRAASLHALTSDTSRGIDLHDAAIVRFENGSSGVLSGSCGVPDGHGFDLELRLYGERGSLLLDIEHERLVLKLDGGAREEASPAPGSWAYSCEGPANALIDLALGRGVNKSPGSVGARAVETLHALTESARHEGRLATISRT